VHVGRPSRRIARSQLPLARNSGGRHETAPANANAARRARLLFSRAPLTSSIKVPGPLPHRPVQAACRLPEPKTWQPARTAGKSPVRPRREALSRPSPPLDGTHAGPQRYGVRRGTAKETNGYVTGRFAEAAEGGARPRARFRAASSRLPPWVHGPGVPYWQAGPRGVVGRENERTSRTRGRVARGPWHSSKCVGPNGRGVRRGNAVQRPVGWFGRSSVNVQIMTAGTKGPDGRPITSLFQRPGSERRLE
jgi:hypothetical protein